MVFLDCAFLNDPLKSMTVEMLYCTHDKRVVEHYCGDSGGQLDVILAKTFLNKSSK